MTNIQLAILIAGFGLAGAIVASLAVHIACWIKSPQVFGDGQYCMIFMIIFPIGWLLAGLILGAWLLIGQVSLAPGAGKVFAVTYLLGLICMPGLPIALMLPFVWIAVGLHKIRRFRNGTDSG